MGRTGCIVVGIVLMSIGTGIFLENEPLGRLFFSSASAEIVVAYAGIIAFFVGFVTVLVPAFQKQ